MGLASFGTGGFDYVRVNRALGQPTGIGQPVGFLVEYFDEQPTDYFAFLLRVFHALERIEISVRRVDTDDLDSHVLGKGCHYLVPLVQAQ